MTGTPHDRENRAFRILLVITALCYGVGYPVALVGHSSLGWALVFLGGPLVICVLVLAIRRIQR